MENYKPMNTSLAKSEDLSLDMCPKTLEEESEMARVPYSSAIRSLMYAMLCTRLDICYAVR